MQIYRGVKKGFLIAMIWLLILGILAGCGDSSGNDTASTANQDPASEGTDKSDSGESSDFSDEFVWWTWSTEATDAYAEILEMFREENPDIDAKIEYIAYEDYWTKLPVSIAGGTGPDIYQMTRPSFELFAASSQAADLTEAIASSERLQANIDEMDPVLVESYQFNGVQMGIPYTVESAAIVYNKTLFEEAGLPEPKTIEDTWTWEDLREMAIQLTNIDDDPTTSQYGFLCLANRTPTWELIWSNGGELFDERMEHSTVASDPKTLEAIDFAAKLHYQDRVSPSVDTLGTISSDDLFLNGKIAMITAGVWTLPSYRQITDFEWDCAQLPLSSNTGERRSASNILGFIVNPNASSPDNIVRFLETAVSPEAQQILADMKIYIPANVNRRDSYFDDASPANIAAYQAALDYVHPNVLTQYLPYAQFTQHYEDALKLAYEGADVKETMQAAEDAMNQIMQENMDNFS